jgi:hypothetical protein
MDPPFFHPNPHESPKPQSTQSTLSVRQLGLKPLSAVYVPVGESLQESRMREICPSGLMRGEAAFDHLSDDPLFHKSVLTLCI